MSNLATAHMLRPSGAFSSAAPAIDPEIDSDLELDLAGVSAPDGSPDSDSRRRRAPWIQIAPSRSQRRARPKIAYAIVVVTGVLAIVITQLLLSVGLSDGAYEIASLQQQQRELDRTNQTLTERFDALSSPQNLATSAETLGMVAGGTPAYLRLSDGAVLGTPSPAAGSAVSGGQLIPNSLLTPAAATATADGASTASADPAAATPSAPTVPAQSTDVPWQGALPSPTTH
ncbi:hypothetical protein N1031_11935 [Herbiconiux moechotypicola]|uniref:Cell division protein FtsL n=1 Tax=Herbiconiux moechotypicola TaxID=637393 RepID=A0ABN3DPE7_9MICO|nr:hypothetical protein [Herbiconiux moechotypicola]MCS5730472.1 hypothetical protein [Herbiconiux moechotypicola]